MSYICNECYKHNDNINFREKFGKRLCNICNLNKFRKWCKVITVKEHREKLMEMYNDIGEEYVYNENEDQLEVFKMLNKRDHYGNTLWEEEKFTAEMYISNRLNELFHDGEPEYYNNFLECIKNDELIRENLAYSYQITY